MTTKQCREGSQVFLESIYYETQVVQPPFGAAEVQRLLLSSLVDEGWHWLSAALNFGVFNWTKKNLNSTQIILGFQSRKTFTTLWSGCKVQVWVQVQAPVCYLAVTPKRYSRRQSKVLLQNQWLSSLGSVQAPGQVGLAATNTAVFPSWLQLLLAATSSLEKKCKNACDTDSVPKSKMLKCFVNFWQWLVPFFMWNKNLIELVRSCYWPKQDAALIDSLDLLIIHWSLMKNRA